MAHGLDLIRIYHPRRIGGGGGQLYPARDYWFGEPYLRDLITRGSLYRMELDDTVTHFLASRKTKTIIIGAKLALVPFGTSD